MTAKKVAKKAPKKKAPKKKAAKKGKGWVTCSVRNGKYDLCNGMSKYMVSNSMVGRTTKGIIDMNNLMNFKTNTVRSLGPVYRPGGKDPGMYFNFCPWCGSDIEKNWRTPEHDRVKAEEARA